MVHSVSGWTRGVQVKLWDPLRMHAIPERLRGVFTTRRYTNPHLPFMAIVGIFYSSFSNSFRLMLIVMCNFDSELHNYSSVPVSDTAANGAAHSNQTWVEDEVADAELWMTPAVILLWWCCFDETTCCGNRMWCAHHIIAIIFIRSC